MNNQGVSPSHTPAGALYAAQQQQIPTNYSSSSRSPASVTSPQYVGNPPPYKPGFMYGSVQTGSNYSSPRSSIGSYDSKGSISPRASLVNPGPPPPYDFQRHGSPHSSGPSPRSSISLDSKQSSPRTSLAGNLHGQIYDKLVNQRYVNQHGAINELSNRGENIPVNQSANVSLYNKYNESGTPPPPPYPDAKMKSMQKSSPVHGSLYGTPQQTNVNRNAGNYAKHNNISPVHSVNSVGRSGATDSSGIHSQSASVPTSLNNTSPKIAMPNAYNNIGLRYDVVPPRRSGPSDVERKLAALTEQLENEMRITGSPSSPSPKKNVDKPPPPPYHGPHMTEPLPMSPPQQVMPFYATSPTSPSSSAGSPSHKVTSPLRTPLPMQVTPPQRNGPSEAERKLEALTQELETQMERHPQGEYFGK